SSAKFLGRQVRASAVYAKSILWSLIHTPPSASGHRAASASAELPLPSASCHRKSRLSVACQTEQRLLPRELPPAMPANGGDGPHQPELRHPTSPLPLLPSGPDGIHDWSSRRSRCGPPKKPWAARL